MSPPKRYVFVIPLATEEMRNIIAGFSKRSLLQNCRKKRGEIIRAVEKKSKEFGEVFKLENKKIRNTAEGMKNIDEFGGYINLYVGISYYNFVLRLLEIWQAPQLTKTKRQVAEIASFYLDFYKSSLSSARAALQVFPDSIECATLLIFILMINNDHETHVKQTISKFLPDPQLHPNLGFVTGFKTGQEYINFLASFGEMSEKGHETIRDDHEREDENENDRENEMDADVKERVENENQDLDDHLMNSALNLSLVEKAEDYLEETSHSTPPLPQWLMSTEHDLEPVADVLLQNDILNWIDTANVVSDGEYKTLDRVKVGVQAIYSHFWDARLIILEANEEKRPIMAALKQDCIRRGKPYIFLECGKLKASVSKKIHCVESVGAAIDEDSCLSALIVRIQRKSNSH